MFGIDERALRISWTVFLFGLALTVVYFIRSTLLIFALAIFFAYMLWPIVTVIQRLVPRRRNLALTAVYCSFIGIIVLAAVEVVPAVANEAASLMSRVPSLLSGTQLDQLPLPAFLRPFEAQVNSALNSQLTLLQSHVVPLLQQAGTSIISGVGASLPAILIPILASFFLKDSDQIRKGLIGAVNDRRDKSLMSEILDDIHLVLKNYIRALVLQSVAAFVGWVIFLTILGYPYELLLAGCAAVGEFIPVVGPAAALATMVGVCLLTQSGGLLWLVVFWGAYRMFSDYILQPYLMSAGVELHPLLVLFGVLAGANIAGIPGMFFSIPAIAILRVLYLNVRKTYIRKQLMEDSRESAKGMDSRDVGGGLIVTPEPTD